MGILRRGKLILSGSVADLLHSTGIVEIALAAHQSAQAVVQQLQIADQVIEAQGNLLHCTEAAQAAILTALVSASIPIVSLNPVSRSLEEVYVSTTGSSDSIDTPLAAARTEHEGER